MALLGALTLAASACSDSGDINGFGPTAGAPGDTATTTAAAPADNELTGSNAVLIDRFTPTEFADADGALLPVEPGSEPWFEFFPDGTLLGNDGCNDYTATFSTSGRYDGFESTTPGANRGQIFASGAFTPTTDNACDEALVAQTSLLTNAIDRAYLWVWAPPNFVLLDLRANPLLTATVAP